MGDEEEVDVTKQFTKLLKAQNVLLERQNNAIFTEKFTGQPQDTLPWIFAANRFLRINAFQNKLIQFQRIFQSLDPYYQNRFMMDKNEAEDEENLTFQKLKEWILQEYPPIIAKHEFKSRLKSMKMYKNEDPNVAYSRFKYKLYQIETAIKEINAVVIPDLGSKLADLTDEDKFDALTAMFVRNNNDPRFNNNGAINQKVQRFIIKESPEEYKEWEEIFKKIKTNLIPKVLRGIKKFETVSYPPNQEDDNIYSKRRNSSFNPQQQRSNGQNHQRASKGYNTRKRRHPPNSQPQNDSTDYHPTKRRRYNSDTRRIKCHRCHKIGHIGRSCWSTHDAQGKYIGPNRSLQQDHSGNHNNTNNGRFSSTRLHCNKCGRNNHNTSDCRSKRPYNKAPQQPTGFKQYKNNQSTTINAPQNQPEVNVLQQKSSNNDQISNQMRALLGKHQNIDPEFAKEIFAIIDPDPDPRQ